MSIVKILLWSLLVLTLVAGAFYAGGSMGYANGYAYHSYYNSTTDAYVTLRTIEMINSRKAAAAKEDLEQRLDTEIVEHWAGLAGKPLDYFSPMRHDDEAVRKLMSKVAAYRKKYPSKTTNPDVRNAIETVVALYYDSTASAPQKRTRR